MKQLTLATVGFERAEEVLTPAVSVRRSVHRDYVVCLDCGYRARHYAATSAPGMA
jgi:predicted transcriptional regulator